MKHPVIKPIRFLIISGMMILMFFLVGFILSGSDTTGHEQHHKTAEATNSSEAMAILKKSLTYLSALESFSVDAQNNMEDLTENGWRVDYEISSSIVVKRPDKLFAERHGNEYNQFFYYNGKTLTQYNPSAKVYAQENAPGTIEEMFHFARDTYGIGAPVSDLIYKNSYELLMYEVEYAINLGNEMIGEVMCQHLIFRKPGVDFQIWISENDEPLPYKYVVTDTATPELLSFTSYMRNWNTSPKIKKDQFEFNEEAIAKKISFIKVDGNDKINQ